MEIMNVNVIKRSIKRVSIVLFVEGHLVKLVFECTVSQVLI